MKSRWSRENDEGRGGEVEKWRNGEIARAEIDVDAGSRASREEQRSHEKDTREGGGVKEQESG